MRALLTLMLIVAGAAAQAEMYRWTDAQGGVHYADHPPPQGAQRIDAPPPAAPLSAEQAGARLKKLRADLEAQAQARAQAQQEAAKAKQARDTLAQQCAQARAQLQAMVSARRVTAPDGTVYHGDQRLKQMEELRASIRERCGAAPR